MNFYETVTAAVKDITENGFDSQKRIDEWMARLRKAAESQLLPRARMEEELRQAYRTIYSRMINRGGIFMFHPGVDRFTLEKLKPAMKRELDRKI